jgi:hypothetical protein
MLNSPRNRARAMVLAAGVVFGVLLSGPSYAAGEATEVTSTFTSLAGDVTTMGLALLALVAGGVVIGLAIRFVTKGKKAASGV